MRRRAPAARIVDLAYGAYQPTPRRLADAAETVSLRFAGEKRFADGLSVVGRFPMATTTQDELKRDALVP